MPSKRTTLCAHHCGGHLLFFMKNSRVGDFKKEKNGSLSAHVLLQEENHQDSQDHT